MTETREEKHLQRLTALYAAGRFSPNTLDQQGMCHIHHAVYRGYLMCAKWLLKHGSSLTVRSAEGSVPAHYAAAGGHLGCLKWIFRKASKSICFTDNSGATPLYFSAQEGHLNCLMWLAKHSGTAHNDMSVDGMTAAHTAALEGHLECMAFLLSSAGCSALARDRGANTPLHYAAACGHRSCVEWLTSNANSVGNERNKLGSSPLHLAAQNGHLEVVKLLVRGGAAIKLRDRLGRTAFNVAIESGNEACAHFLYQVETSNIDGANDLILGKYSLKRVRFERKAIERDSESQYPQRHLNHFKERGIRKPYSLYRNSAESGLLLKHHSSLRVENNRDEPPYERSQIDETYVAHFPKGRDSAFEDLQMQNYVTSRSLLPWSRVYRMTQSTESLPSSYQPKVYGSYSLSDSYGRGDVSSERHHYKVTSFENPSPEKESTSFLSRFISRRKDKELFPAEVDNLDDIVSSNSRNGNVFKRLYRFSKKKVTRSSSFSIDSFTDDVHLTKKNSFVVSGNDDFLFGSTSHQPRDPVMQQEKEEILSPEKTKTEFSTTVKYSTRSRSSKNEESSRKIKKRLANEAKSPSSSRENSLIW